MEMVDVLLGLSDLVPQLRHLRVLGGDDALILLTAIAELLHLLMLLPHADTHTLSLVKIIQKQELVQIACVTESMI